MAKSWTSKREFSDVGRTNITSMRLLDSTRNILKSTQASNGAGFLGIYKDVEGIADLSLESFHES
jgi:hypothetical protein